MQINKRLFLVVHSGIDHKGYSLVVAETAASARYTVLEHGVADYYPDTVFYVIDVLTKLLDQDTDRLLIFDGNDDAE